MKILSKRLLFAITSLCAVGVFSASAMARGIGEPQPESMTAPPQLTLSETVYPEYIVLSENFQTAEKLYSPIDRDYNAARVNVDFIDSSAFEFTEIWRRELEFQYGKCIENMPDEYKEQFKLQQESWVAYYENDVFPEIAFAIDEETGEELGYGFTREAQLIRLDRMRKRTIELMQLQTHLEGVSVEFEYTANAKALTE